MLTKKSPGTDVPNDSSHHFKVLLIQILMSTVLLYLTCLCFTAIDRVCTVVCGKVAILRVPARNETAALLKVLFYLVSWGVSITGFWYNATKADPVALLCFLLPLAMCTYFVGLPAVFMCTACFYEVSTTITTTSFKSVLVVMCASFTFCYMQEHRDGPDMIPNMEGVEMMPLAIVLPLLPLAKAFIESRYKKLEEGLVEDDS
jgi:hypothetical protein